MTESRLKLILHLKPLNESKAATQENIAAWNTMLARRSRETIKKTCIVLGAVREAHAFRNHGVFHNVDSFMQVSFMRRIQDKFLGQAGL